MVSRRMRIEDYELMIQARKARIAALRGRAAEELTGADREALAVLEGDDRLEKPLLMVWDVEPHFDAAIIDALELLARRAVEDAGLRGVPPEDRQLWAEGRRGAIADCLARLRGQDPETR